MAVLHGEGKNGKTTLVKLFEDLLGDYSFVAPPRIILRMQQSSSEAQYQFAQMKGARFVSMSETPRHVELEEATVKQITGNDTLNARHPFGRHGDVPREQVGFRLGVLVAEALHLVGGGEVRPRLFVGGEQRRHGSP